MPHSLIDPRWMTTRGVPGGYFPSLATVYGPVETTGTVGQKVRVWTTVVLSAVRCRLAPLVTIRPTSAEARLQDMVRTENTRQILFPAYYPQIKTNMRVMVEAVLYDVLANERDGNAKLTRLRVEIVSL